MRSSFGLILVAIGLSACTTTSTSSDSGRDASADSPTDSSDGGGLDAIPTDASRDSRGLSSDGGDASPPDGAQCDGPREPKVVWLIGDSTVATDSGWGDFLADFVGMVDVRNRAWGGASSRSFYEVDDNTWTQRDNAVIRNIAAGDYVFIQFGHNDQNPDPVKYTDPGEPPDHAGSYREYLERYIQEARAAGGVPVLITPVSTMYFDDETTHRRGHGQYPSAVLRVGLDHSIPVLDLEQRSHELFESLGETETHARFAHYMGRPLDFEHFEPEKAPPIAELVAELLREAAIPLSCHVL